jgi:prepilin-type N-terminal cleavage/methylation domain-containing protein
MLRRIKGFTLIELLIVVAIIAILAAIAVPNFLEAQTRSKVTRVKADQRTLATALESYYIDNNTYPAQDSSSGSGGTEPAIGAGCNQMVTVKDKGEALMPVFRIKTTSTDPLMTLTTPISYITSYFGDPFADTKGACFAFSNTPLGYGTGWILWSYGPDCDENVAQSTAYPVGGDILVYSPADQPFWAPQVMETFYNAAGTVPSVNLLMYTYDPTETSSLVTIESGLPEGPSTEH